MVGCLQQGGPTAEREGDRPAPPGRRRLYRQAGSQEVSCQLGVCCSWSRYGSWHGCPAPRPAQSPRCKIGSRQVSRERYTSGMWPVVCSQLLRSALGGLSFFLSVAPWPGVGPLICVCNLPNSMPRRAHSPEGVPERTGWGWQSDAVYGRANGRPPPCSPLQP